jgi:DNA-binding NtrC family response regulator
MKSLGRILIVDDEEAIRKVLSDYLSNMNLDIETAVDGRDALKKHMEKAFDIIISDLVMPNIDGLSLLKKVREMDENVIFIMITGYPTIQTAVETIKEGADDYITKPFRMEDVQLRINRAFEKKSLKDRLKNIKALVWALLLSIPLWLLLGIVLASLMN